MRSSKPKNVELGRDKNTSQKWVGTSLYKVDTVTYKVATTSYWTNSGSAICAVYRANPTGSVRWLSQGKGNCGFGKRRYQKQVKNWNYTNETVDEAASKIANFSVSVSGEKRGWWIAPLAYDNYINHATITSNLSVGTLYYNKFSFGEFDKATNRQLKVAAAGKNIVFMYAEYNGYYSNTISKKIFINKQLGKYSQLKNIDDVVSSVKNDCTLTSSNRIKDVDISGSCEESIRDLLWLDSLTYAQKRYNSISLDAWIDLAFFAADAAACIGTGGLACMPFIIDLVVMKNEHSTGLTDVTDLMDIFSGSPMAFYEIYTQLAIMFDDGDYDNVLFSFIIRTGIRTYDDNANDRLKEIYLDVYSNIIAYYAIN